MSYLLRLSRSSLFPLGTRYCGPFKCMPVYQFTRLFTYFLQSGNQEIDIDDADRDNPFDEPDNIHENRMPADRDAFGSEDDEPDARTPVPGSDDGINDDPTQSSSDSALEIGLDNLRECQDFIDFIKAASLGDGQCGMLADDIESLMEPATERLFDENTTDPDFRLSLDCYLACSNASQDVYNKMRDAIKRRYPDSEILSYDQISRRVRNLSGVVPIIHDMCVNSCMAYTGPFSPLQACRFCSAPRYMSRKGKPIAPEDITDDGVSAFIPRLQFHTIPLGPQLQPLFRDPKSANNMKHRQIRTRKILRELQVNNVDFPAEYDDVYCGQDYLEAVRSGDIGEDSVLVVWSQDGAQLYQSKKSDAWIGIWTVMELSPHIRYKKDFVLPGVVIPGPNNPKHLDSFIFPSLHHVGALQNHGLRVWDASENRVRTKHPYVLYGTTDSVAAADLNGWVGHHGRKGCRYMCGLNGRHKPRTPHYFPVLLQPRNCAIIASNHPDVDINSLKASTPEDYQHNLQRILASPNQTQYKVMRRETGITKPSLFSGLSAITPIPRLFPGDCMHRDGLNLPELLLGLWRGTLESGTGDDKSTWDWAVLTGKVWEDHGKEVASCKKYIPVSLESHAPRNPAEKISSGYKASEYMVYLYGLGPGLLYGILPDIYWRHYCKVVHGIRTIHRPVIHQESLARALQLLLEFVLEFETLYYQRDMARFHFI